MARLTTKIYMLAGALALAGVMVQASARAERITRSEDSLEKLALKSFDGFSMNRARDPDHPDVTYRMDEASYKELRPFGIVAREFSNGKQPGQGLEAYDVVLIASNDKASFHDPRVCFTAQGWELVSEKKVLLPTKSRGEIEVTLAEMKHKDHGKRPAIYFYRGPRGFSAGTFDLKMQMAIESLTKGTLPEGVFYRFMPLNEVSSDKLLAFTARYMDASGPATQNYF